MGPTYVNGSLAASSTAGVCTLDLSRGNVFLIALTEDITSLAASNAKEGQDVGILFVQDASARTVTPDGTTIAFKGGATAIPQGAAAAGVTTAQGKVYGGVLYITGTVVGA